MNLNLNVQSAILKADLIGPRALNPQPLPPKAHVSLIKNPIGPRALNPQPLPPKDAKSAWSTIGTIFSGPLVGTKIGQPIGGARSEAFADPLAKVALNPQPLPPKVYAGGVADHFNDVALNPQPLPPKALSAVPFGGPPLPDPAPFSFAQLFAKFKAVFAM